MKRICVFCGSSPGARPEYTRAARALGEGLARRGLTLVYGGATVGLMGTIADAVLANGGEVIGVIPRGLEEKEIAHRQLTQLRIVPSMHERKKVMSDLADAFIAAPGGFGTLDELAEILTWAQLGIHAKPCALLDTANFFRPLLAYLDHAVDEGFIKPDHRALLTADADPERLLDRLTAR